MKRLKGKIKKLMTLGAVIIVVFSVILNFESSGISSRDAASASELSSMPILMYHDVTLDPLKSSKICVTKEKFARDLDYIEAAGYTTISFQDIIDFENGDKDLPDKPMLITFDDGRLGVYKYAYPMLKERNMKCTFFVIGERLDNKPENRKYGEYINWKQAKEMYDSGLVEIQPHTYDMHFSKESLTRSVGVLPLTGESERNHYNRFKDDTVKIVKAIKERVGSESYVYSYPYGKFNATNDKVLHDLGFTITTRTKTSYADFSNGLYDISRINVPSNIELEDLLRRVADMDKDTAKAATASQTKTAE